VTANEKHQCYGIKKILVLLSSNSITEGRGFLPIAACPAIALATADLPMGKKKNNLCVLCDSVVKKY
jgi:hypothetical protein